MVSLRQVELPTFGGREETPPPITTAEYAGRLSATCERMKELKLDVLLVYADREHSANLAFLTGFDARFEEAALLMDTRGNRALLVGNECMGYLPDPALLCEPVLFQEFSLMGQPRDESPPLRSIFSEFGIGKATAVGCVGWKYFEAGRVENPSRAMEIPAYLVDLLRDITGEAGLVRNANSILMNPADGLRVINSAAQIARFEFAAVHTSESVLDVIRNIREGVSERELERLLYGAGIPRSCHPMISFGEKVKRGLSSPSGNKAHLGDAFVVAYGIQGALNCRAGAVARGPDDLAPELRDFYPRFAANYFEVAAAWYGNVRLGALGGEVFDAVNAARDKDAFEFAVSPGHYIHLDEWVHSPFAPGSRFTIRSGMALQLDVIPVSKGPFCYVNAEDGIVVADEELRAEIASLSRSRWERIQARRAFMQEQLGIRLDESILPLSNIPGWLPPYVLDSGKVLALT